MRIKILFLSLFALVFAAALGWTQSTQAQTAESHFQTGIAAYQKGEMDAARSAFQESLKFSDNNPVVLYNLALVEQRQGKLGAAMALWRKALALDPAYTAAWQALEWSHSKLDKQDIPHEVSLWESFRNSFLVRLSLDWALSLTAVSLLVSGWLLLTHFGRRRKALLEEGRLPGFPVLASIASLLLFGCIILSAAKAFEINQVRATIIDKKVSALSSPSAGGTELFDLYEGLEVIVRQVSDDWAQVTYPGATTGWIPRKSLLTTQGREAGR